MKIISIDKIDLISQNLVQAASILQLPINDGQDLREGFQMSNKTIMDAIWCISTLVGNARNQVS